MDDVGSILLVMHHQVIASLCIVNRNRAWRIKIASGICGLDGNVQIETLHLHSVYLLDTDGQ